MKKAFIIPTVFLGIIGGYVIAQTDVFTSAEKTTTITAGQAKKLALATFDGNIIEFEYDHDDAVPHYDFEIIGSTEKVDLEVNAMTGNVIITERETIKKAAQSQVTQAIKKTENQVDASVANAQVITQTAIQQATQSTKEPTTTQPQQQATQTTKEQATQRQQVNNYLTKAQALAIAQQKVNGTVTKVEFDDDNEYEIEIKNGQKEYEFTIHAVTGAILSYEVDDDDDDLDD